MRLEDIDKVLENAKGISTSLSQNSFNKADTVVQLIEYIIDHQNRLSNIVDFNDKIFVYHYGNDCTMALNLESKYIYYEFKYISSMVETFTIDIKEDRGNLFIAMSHLYNKRLDCYYNILNMLINLASKIADDIKVKSKKSINDIKKYRVGDVIHCKSQNLHYIISDIMGENIICHNIKDILGFIPHGYGETGKIFNSNSDDIELDINCASNYEERK